MFKDLFITDLDGTLLNSDMKISKESEIILNKLIDKGALVTFATARTYLSCLDIVKNVNFNLPIITMNGSAIYDIKTKTHLDLKTVNETRVKQVLDFAKSLKLSLLTHTIEKDEIFVYYNDYIDKRGQKFIDMRKNLKGIHYIKDIPKKGATTVYLTINGYKEKLMPLYGYIKKSGGLEVSFYKDVYDKNIYYLEIYNKDASKANASIQLKNQLKAKRLIVFGDNDNDISMFKVSDECYAVENATDKVLDLADFIIESNNDNSVAKKMMELSKGV